MLHSFLLPTLGWLDQAKEVFSPIPIPCLHSCRTLLRKKIAFPRCEVRCLRWPAHWLPAHKSALFGPWPSFVYDAALVLSKRLLRLSLEPMSSSPDAALARVLRPVGPHPRTPSRRRSAVPVLDSPEIRLGRLNSVGRFLVCWLPRLLFDGVSIVNAGTQCIDRSWQSLKYDWMPRKIKTTTKSMDIAKCLRMCLAWCSSGCGANTWVQRGGTSSSKSCKSLCKDKRNAAVCG